MIKVIRKRFEKRPDYLTSGFYWTSVFFLAAVGAGVAVWRDPGSPVDAVAYGAAALAFITQIFALPDDKHLGVDPAGEKPGTIQRIRRWWGS
jgi:hypothetical protein